MTATDAQYIPPSEIQVNLFYEPNETEIISLEEKSRIEMQAECPDFQDIINYLPYITPDDPKCRDSLISVKLHHCYINVDTLYNELQIYHEPVKFQTKLHLREKIPHLHL